MSSADEVEELAKVIEEYEKWHLKELGVLPFAYAYAEHILKAGYTKGA
jgi:hypothetical protein